MSATSILAVEDDEVLGRLYQSVLTRDEWSVVVAGTLADAARVVAERPVSLVLLDLFLPDGDGRTWLRELRADPRHAATPVIVVAGSALIEAQVDCYELGADTMIAKPVAPAVLVAAITGALNRRKGAAPASAPQAAGARSIAATAANAGAGHVLLAEDDAVVAALVKHRLTREGYTVHHASDGVAAMDMSNAQPLSLAILDVMLPGLDGFELLGRLRRDSRTEQVPVVMLTGLGGERDVERALALGADDYVLKPFSPVELTARVQRLVRRR